VTAISYIFSSHNYHAIWLQNNINDRDYRFIPERRLQDNLSDRDYRFTPDRRLQEFADCLKEVAVILQRNGQVI